MRGRVITVACLAVCAALVLSALASAPAYAAPAQALDELNLLSNGSFEGSLVGWVSLNSVLALVSDGVVGVQAAQVGLAGGSSSTAFGLIASPPAIGSAVAGRIYNAGGWVRSDTPGRQLCLRVRERQADGSYLYQQSCLSGQTGWQQFPPLTYTTVAGGDRVDVYVSEYGAQAGDAFEVDGLWLGPDTTPPQTTITAGPASYVSV